jgi:hypothetical protein
MSGAGLPRPSQSGPYTLKRMGLQGFERRLERLIEGAFARAFRSGLRPIELGRRVGRELDNERSVDVRGRTVVPNRLVFTLNVEDHQRFQQISDGLRREIAEVAREHASDRGYHFLGPVTVDFAPESSFHTGRFELKLHYRENTDGAPPGALLMPDGSRVSLGTETLTIGRFGECDIVIDDPNISRRHAQVAVEQDAHVLIDLGSTNGLTVNGHRIERHELRHGDAITLGANTIVFEGG